MNHHTLIVKTDDTMRQLVAPVSKLHRLNKMTFGIGDLIIAPSCRRSRKISIGSSCVFIGDVRVSLDIVHTPTKKTTMYSGRAWNSHAKLNKVVL